MTTPSKWGNEFLVNTIISDHQSAPAVSDLANGRFVVTWTDLSKTLGDGSESAIHAQILNADGSKAGAEFLVNTTTNNRQVTAATTGLADGRFVVTWTDWSNGGGGGVEDVRAQIFNSDGTKSGGEFIVNTQTAHPQVQPAIATLTGGRFVAMWRTHDGSGNADIHAQMFNPDGTRSGSEFLVNTSTQPQSPVITGLANGRFVVAWNRANSDIQAQIFEADGSKSGVEFAVTAAPTTDADPSITALANGGFIVSWDKDFSSDVQAQVFDANGAKSGTDFLVNTTTTAFQSSSSLAALPDGRFVAAWTDSSQTGADASSDAIRAQAFNSDGTKSGAEFLVNTTTINDQERPSISVLADGRFVVAWSDFSQTGGDQSGLAVRAQIFDPRETAVNFNGTALNDDRVGTKFDDVMKGAGGDDHLDGAGGNDTLVGGDGNDAIDGGAGDDTAAFSHDFNDYTVMDFGAKLVVAGPDGIDTLTGIEHLQFIDVTITPVDDGNPLFDTLYYLSRNADVFHAGVNALEHFNASGRYEGRDPNGFFDVSGYLAANPDVAAAGVNPLEHYHQTGWQQGRDPAANFDTTLYLIRNPDVAAAGIDPLAHFLAFGFSEGRAAYAAVGPTVNGFDAQYYLLHNPDVAAAGVDPLAHFNIFGWHEGRNPNGYFDSAGYLAHYADVAAAGVNPLQHYLAFGWHEGRDPSAGFDTLGYLAANPDVAAAGVDPLDHFLTFGIYEGRQAVNDGLWH